MEYSLEELFDLQMGKTPSRNVSEYWETGVNKWISIADLSKCGKYIYNTKECLSDSAIAESGIKQIPVNTVVMSFKLSIGKTAITSEPMYSNEAIMSFRDRKIVQLLPEYVYYLLSSKNWDDGTNKAVMGKTLNKATLSKVKVKIHSVQGQKKIVCVLNQASDLIELRQQQLEKLDELVKARFVELFGDPISNPNGWKTEKAEMYIDLCSGFPFDSSQYTESGVNICGGLIIMPQRIEWNDCKHWCSTEGYEEYTLKKNDIVIALDRPWISEGFKIAMVDTEHLPALLIQRTARIRAIDINQFYLMYCFLLGGFDNHCNVTGSLVPHISAKDIRSFPIMLPPMGLQEQFAAFVEQVNKSKVAVQKSLDEAQLLFDSLMQQYFG